MGWWFFWEVFAGLSEQRNPVYHESRHIGNIWWAASTESHRLQSRGSSRSSSCFWRSQERRVHSSICTRGIEKSLALLPFSITQVEIRRLIKLATKTKVKRMTPALIISMKVMSDLLFGWVNSQEQSKRKLFFYTGYKIKILLKWKPLLFDCFW